MNAQEYLKTTRRQLGFTQKSLAQATGHETHDIKNYENGLARVPGDLILQLQAMIEAENRRKKAA